MNESPTERVAAKNSSAGLEWKTNLWEGRVGRDGIEAAISGVFERFDDVPGATDDQVAKINVKLEYPISDVLKLPLSITWADNTELLQGESEIRGHIGFTVDFDTLLQPTSK